MPTEIRHQFQDLLSDCALVPSLRHYLKSASSHASLQYGPLLIDSSFLDSWRSGDYPTSFDNLHRYFDYTMQNRDRLFYQYALMNLAVLQADFGCHQDAVATMLETISTARENKDMTCLNFSLSWLFHYGRAHPDLIRNLETDSVLGHGKESLAYLRVKAKETGMWSLWSSALLSEAKMGLANGESVASSFELMVRSSQLIVERNMRNMFGSQLTVSMSLWERLGVTHLSTVEAQIFLRCHTRHAIFDDQLKFTCRLAIQLAEMGKYDESLKSLEALDENGLRSWKPSQHWHKCRGIIKVIRDLRRSHLEGVDQLLSQLLQSEGDDLEPELQWVTNFLHVDYLIRRGNLQSAFGKVEHMLHRLQEDKRDINLRIRLMLLKVRLFDKAGRPQRGFTLAVRAASLAWQARLMPSLWEAIGALANILRSLGEFEAAARLLTAVIPRSLECDSAATSGILYSHLSDANMGIAGNAPRTSARRMEYLTKAAAAVQKAFDRFSGIEDVERQCEMMAKKATIMKVAGDKVLAADYAAAYVALRRSNLVMAT